MNYSDINNDNFHRLTIDFDIKTQIKHNYLYWCLDFIKDESTIELNNFLLNVANQPSLEDCLKYYFKYYEESFNSFNIPKAPISIETYNTFDDINLLSLLEDKVIKMMAVTIEDEYKMIYEYSFNNNLYFKYCSSLVFINTIRERFEKAIKHNHEMTYVDFLKEEYLNVLDNYFLVDHLNGYFLETFENSQKSKIDYINDELRTYKVIPTNDYKKINSKDVHFIEMKSTISDEDGPMDLTNKQLFNVVVNVVLLDKLGILDFLSQKYKNDIQSISKICSLITKLDKNTIRRYLSSTMNNNIIDRNYIYGSESNKALKVVLDLLKENKIDI